VALTSQKTIFFIVTAVKTSKLTGFDKTERDLAIGHESIDFFTRMTASPSWATKAFVDAPNIR
jgi:hypothetical protein